MPRVALLLIAAALLGAGLFFLLGPGSGGGGDTDGDFTYEDGSDYTADPALRASGGTGKPPKDGNGANDRPKDPQPAKDVVWMAGEVIDAASGDPVGGASLRFEPMRQPCPRMPQHGAPKPDKQPASSSVIPAANIVHGVTAKDGTFQITRPAGAPNPGAHDLFVFAPGYVTTCLCAASGDGIVVRLERSVIVKGRVADATGRGLEGATVRAFPPEKERPVPGRASAAITDREGRFQLDGLTAGAVMIEAKHPAFMPTRVGPRETTDTNPLEIRLVPAYRVTFHLRSDDGESIVNPVVRWKTDGDPPAEELRILRGTPIGPPARKDAELRGDVLKIPCDRRTVDFEIKADGYLPWSTKGEPLPADGGERTYPVTLSRDQTVGALRIRIEDKDGKAVSFKDSGSTASLGWLGPPDQMPTSFVLTASDVLDLPSLRAGPYRVTIRSPKYAPAEVEVTVVAGQVTEAKVRAEPPAKLAVRFSASEQLTVRFRVTKDGRVTLPFVEGKETPAGAQPGAEPLSASGGGAAVILSGFGAGAHVIEVMSENLVATRRTVTLTPGETAEVEIEVQRK